MLMMIITFLYVFLCFLVHPLWHPRTCTGNPCCCDELRELIALLVVTGESCKPRCTLDFWTVASFQHFCTSFHRTPVIRSRFCHRAYRVEPLGHIRALVRVIGRLDLPQRRAPRPLMTPTQLAYARFSLAFALALVRAFPRNPLSPLLCRRSCVRRRSPRTPSCCHRIPFTALAYCGAFPGQVKPTARVAMPSLSFATFAAFASLAVTLLALAFALLDLRLCALKGPVTRLAAVEALVATFLVVAWSPPRRRHRRTRHSDRCHLQVPSPHRCRG